MVIAGSPLTSLCWGLVDLGVVGLERERDSRDEETEEREEHLTREGLEQCFSILRSSPDKSGQTTDARVKESSRGWLRVIISEVIMGVKHTQRPPTLHHTSLTIFPGLENQTSPGSGSPSPRLTGDI